jgi:hypothetical protein
MPWNKKGHPAEVALSLLRCGGCKEGYLETALWSSTDTNHFDENGKYAGGGENLDASYSVEDFAAEALAQAIDDCRRFQSVNTRLLAQAYAHGRNEGSAGHDFWLTRNHHGAGFWDGDYPKEVGDKLTDAAHAFGELNPHAENGKVYFA